MIFIRLRDSCWIKSNGNSSILLTWLYSQGYNIYVPSIQSLPLFNSICQMLGRRCTSSAHTPLLMFRIDRPIAWINSSLVLYRVPRSGSYTLANRSESHGFISCEYGECSTISHYQRHGVRDPSQQQQQCELGMGGVVIFPELFRVFRFR